MEPASKQGRSRHKRRRNHPKHGADRSLRRNVGLVVVNHAGLVLAGLRYHTASKESAWQLPQGGIEGRERPLTAAYRELAEESGLQPDEVTLVAENAGWTTYYLPREWTQGRRFKGQTQKWFLFRYLKDDLPDISRAAHKEFSELKWVQADWLHDHVIAFRKPIYAEVFKNFRNHLK
ncbi:MAG TPA: RNA pyrophosphohydrolase [Alphaproteobacteria bacterium]|nr:RNA pyrophosphohydrolase [Alphaproteobacteria bacterium]